MRVCVLSYTIPTRRKSPPVESPWLMDCRIPPWMPALFSAKRPSMTKPRCATDEYATSFFMSFWTIATIEP